MNLFLKGCTLFALAWAGAGNFAGDWPQWGGPHRDHASKETGLLQQWPQEGPKRVWLSDKGGIGYAGFAVAGGKLFTMGARDQVEHLLAFDVADGKELWAAPIGKILENNWGDGPRGTPAVAGEHVYALGAQGTLVAVAVADGKLAWKRTMEELGGKVPGWGYTESVLVEGGKVYCTPGGGKGTLAALDALTGELKWQSSEATESAHYSSIVPADLNGARQLIQLTEKVLLSVNAESGKLLWKSPWPGRVAVIPTPVVRGQHVYITSGYGTGCKLVEISPENSPKDVYENKVMKNHHGGVVLVGDYIYGYSDGPGWVCQKFLTGEEKWASEALGKGAVMYADGRLYCVEQDKGIVVLAEASPDGWKEQGRFTLAPQSSLRKRDGRVWTHPVVAGGRMYLRDQEYLYCFDVRAAN